MANYIQDTKYQLFALNVLKGYNGKM